LAKKEDLWFHDIIPRQQEHQDFFFGFRRRQKREKSFNQHHVFFSSPKKDSFSKTKFPETQPMETSHRRSDMEEKYYKSLREYYLYGKIRCWHVSKPPTLGIKDI